MDIHCANCGEPWDYLGMRDDLDPEREMGLNRKEDAKQVAEQGFLFAGNWAALIACPCCKSNKPHPNADGRKETVSVLADLLGDDADGLASFLDDWGFK